MILAMFHLVFGISSVLQPIEDAVRWLLERFHYDVGLPWAWASSPRRSSCASASSR